MEHLILLVLCWTLAALKELGEAIVSMYNDRPVSDFYFKGIMIAGSLLWAVLEGVYWAYGYFFG